MWQRLHRQRRGRIAAATAATASKHQSEPGCTLSFLKGLIVPAAEPVGLLSPPTAPIWVPQFTPPASPIPHHWRSALCHRATIRGGSHGQSGRIKKIEHSAKRARKMRFKGRPAVVVAGADLCWKASGTGRFCERPEKPLVKQSGLFSKSVH